MDYFEQQINCGDMINVNSSKGIIPENNASRASVDQPSFTVNRSAKSKNNIKYDHFSTESNQDEKFPTAYGPNLKYPLPKRRVISKSGHHSNERKSS